GVQPVTQEELWHETLEDALKSVLIASFGKGWAQKAAHAMYGQVDVIAKGKWLEKALNVERSEKLAPSDIEWILRKGRDIGCHTGMAYIARACGYADPVPVDPEDERAELQRAFLSSVKAQKDILKRMEALAK
ncbi:MAG: hypothetical protein ACPGVG_15175, partial [Mycobacterium sp.]